MKYRIIKLGSRNHAVDVVGYHQIQMQLVDGATWGYVPGSTTPSLDEAEKHLAAIIADKQTEDEVIKEVTV